MAELEETALRDRLLKQKNVELEIAALKQQVELQALKDSIMLLSSTSSNLQHITSDSEAKAAAHALSSKRREEFEWGADWDENGYMFFRNKATFETQWEEPLLYEVMVGKPCPWIEATCDTSEDGYGPKVYYYNRATFESVWEKVISPTIYIYMCVCVCVLLLHCFLVSACTSPHLPVPVVALSVPLCFECRSNLPYPPSVVLLPL